MLCQPRFLDRARILRSIEAATAASQDHIIRMYRGKGITNQWRLSHTLARSSISCARTLSRARTGGNDREERRRDRGHDDADAVVERYWQSGEWSAGLAPGRETIGKTASRHGGRAFQSRARRWEEYDSLLDTQYLRDPD